MQKKYSPVQVRNPVSTGHLVRLRPGQELSLVFTKPEFLACSVNISGTFLNLKGIEPVQGGWSALVEQSPACLGFCEMGLFLGEIHVLGGDTPSSLFVVTDAPNTDFLRVIQPGNGTFRLEPHQVLDVLFYSPEYGDQWACDIVAGHLRLEQIEYRVNSAQHRHYSDLLRTLPLCDGECPVEEHHFRFRLDSRSIQAVQSLPTGKYEGGSLVFGDGSRERATVNVLLNWKETKRNEVYKALLLPRTIGPVWKQHHKRNKPKQAMQANVVVRKMQCVEMDEGCNVIWSKCR
jgi:hypothetical protein